MLAEKDRYCVSNTCIGCLFLQVSRRREGVWRKKYEGNARFFPTIDAYDVFIQDKALLFRRGEDHCFSRFGKEKIILHASFKGTDPWKRKQSWINYLYKGATLLFDNESWHCEQQCGEDRIVRTRAPHYSRTRMI